MTKRLSLLPLALGLMLLTDPWLIAQQDRLIPAPDRRSGEGRGPFSTLTITNVIVIDGTGAPPAGPMNVIDRAQPDCSHHERRNARRAAAAGRPGARR